MLNAMSLTKHLLRTLLLLFVISGSAFSQELTNSRNSEVQSLIASLYSHPWPGAENACSPMCWGFHFTKPMLKILDIGPSAQAPLLEKVDDPAIKDQIIILLGGLGDEGAVGSIIDAMVAKDDVAFTPHAERINLAANLALTNITVADVIWHHGGGIEVRRCPENPKECWAEWWKKNKATFTVKEIKQSRRYSNYPNYGIYKQQ